MSDASTPTPGPNRDLPALSPLKARSTIAAILAFLALVGPLLNGGLGELVTSVVDNGDAIQGQAETAVNAINALIGVAGLVWFWAERRAPNFRLSFRSR